MQQQQQAMMAQQGQAQDPAIHGAGRSNEGSD